jgi:hypothetical protein
MTGRDACSTSCKALLLKTGVFLLMFLLLLSNGVQASGNRETPDTYGSFINKESNWYKLQGGLEIGFLDVVSHTIQFGTNGSKLDYVDEGGQGVLFPFSRLTAELNLSRTHNVIFLIQPLDIRTEALSKRDVIVDDLAFPEDTPLELRYGFTFYRLSYLYDFAEADNKELAIGLSLQIRNATISFASADGSLFRINENVGPVPIFKFRSRHPFNDGMWFGTEVDGFYASGKYITGSENDFEGAILDASLRIGFELTDYVDTFVNVRYIGGGAKGTEEDDPGPGDGFTDNWLHTVSVSLGFYLR